MEKFNDGFDDLFTEPIRVSDVSLSNQIDEDDQTKKKEEL